MQNGRQREQAVVSAAEAAIALQGIVPPPAYCMGVLCFVRDESLAGWARDVMVSSTSNLAVMLTSRPAVLGPDDVRRCAEVVRARTATRTATKTAPRTAPLPMPRRQARIRRTTKKRGRPVLALVGMLVLLASIWSGAYQEAAGWVGQRFVEVFVTDVPAAPAPAEPAEQKREKKVKNAKQQNQQG
jgi:hypothetical protein